MSKENKEIKLKRTFSSKNKDLKIIIVGDSGTGKTSFVNRYILNKFVESYQATIVSQFSNKILKINDVTYRLNFWDIAGQDRNQGTTKLFCKNSNGIVLCCEVNEKNTRDNTIKWKESLEQNINLDKIPIILVENKCDLLGDNEEDYNKDIEELKNFTQQNNINNCFRTSSMNGYGIEEYMDYLIKEIIELNNFDNEYVEEESMRETIALSEKAHSSIRTKRGNCC